MKILKSSMFLSCFIAILCFGASAFATCSNASLKGGYGFSVTGYNKNGSLITVIGQLNANGSGKLTGVETESDAGQILANVPVSGKYSVQSDCNGTATIAAKGGKATPIDLAVVGGGASFQMLSSKTGTVESAIAQSQGKPTCTDAGVKGTYGILANGNFTGVGNVAFSGQFAFDGAGNITGTESGSLAGQIFTNENLTGTYSVNSNCTGSATFQVSGQPAQHANFVVINGGKAMYLIETDSNTTVSGEGQL